MPRGYSENAIFPRLFGLCPFYECFVKHIFNALNMVKFNDVKVVIIGQDPYINEGDKTPSWDGELFVYNSEDFNKNNLKATFKLPGKSSTVSKNSSKYSAHKQSHIPRSMRLPHQTQLSPSL